MSLHYGLKKWMNVRKGERVMAFLAFVYFFFLLSGYYILRPVRDEMGIQGGVRQLPWLFTGTFIAIISAVPLYATIASRFPVRKFVPLVYRFFNVNLLLFWILFQWGRNPEWIARSFFIWTSVFNLFVVSVFWSLMV
ncbi:MAG TPA: MFS transporter, partial [bacterium]|nr:MFS transporter [bacterium]